MKKILIIDDNFQNRLLLKMLLTGVGYNVLEACDGKSGLKKAIDELPDLIILDIMMPDIDGFEVAKQLKLDILTKDIPVIFLSAYEDHIEKLDTSAIYLSKPIDIDKLIKTIEKVLAQNGNNS